MRIFIVDDEPAYAEYLRVGLITALPEIEVAVTHNGVDISSKLNEFSPDVVLLDLNMP